MENLMYDGVQDQFRPTMGVFTGGRNDGNELREHELRGNEVWARAMKSVSTVKTR